MAHLCIKKAIPVIVLIVDVRDVVIVIVVVIHMVLEAVPIGVPVKILGGKDNPKDSKKKKDGKEEFVRTHYDLENYQNCSANLETAAFSFNSRLRLGRRLYTEQELAKLMLS